MRTLRKFSEKILISVILEKLGETIKKSFFFLEKCVTNFDNT